MEVGEENVILNCDYDFDEEEAQQLEIKWYFRKDPAPFFQWIAGLPDSKESLKSYLYLLTRRGGTGNTFVYHFFIFNYQLLNDIL